MNYKFIDGNFYYQLLITNKIRGNGGIGRHTWFRLKVLGVRIPLPVQNMIDEIWMIIDEKIQLESFITYQLSPIKLEEWCSRSAR